MGFKNATAVFGPKQFWVRHLGRPKDPWYVAKMPFKYSRIYLNSTSVNTTPKPKPTNAKILPVLYTGTSPFSFLQ